MYGNGGMSSWTKEFVYNMKTHEASDGSDDTAVEFCFDKDYWAMHDCFSTTYPNATAEQAWRAGFREGVKMCLNRGTKPTIEEFEANVVKRNYDHLCIWMSIGDDVENGAYARAGAMLGTYLTMIGDHNRFRDFDYRNVQDFDVLESLWAEFDAYISEISTEMSMDSNHRNGIDIFMQKIGKTLKNRLSLNIHSFDAEASKFFKHHYKAQFHNKGIMVSEMDVIRGIEGW